MKNPKSQIPNPKLSRRGVTIVEVLFAILITTVGLFGAIAIFPFASAQARRSRIFDMMAVAGRSSFHDFDARGMRRPDMWLAWDQNARAFVPALSVSNRQPTESYCIDPRVIAAHMSRVTIAGNPRDVLLPTSSSSSNLGGQCVQTFPLLEPFTDSNQNGFWEVGELASDLNSNGALDPPQFNPLNRNFDSSLMRRLTLRQSGNPNLASYNPLFPMTLFQANSIFLIDDDLTYNRPDDDRSLPASQTASGLDPSIPIGPANPWGRRQTDGKISWLATLVPKFDISGLASDEYTLSVVMIHERPSNLDRLDHLGERVVTGVWQSPGATGGEIRLVAAYTPECQEQLKLRPNDWVMVSGSYGLSATGPIITRFQWYRIADCDTNPTETTNAAGVPNGYELYATLMGQDWNMNFISPPVGVTGAAAGQVRVTIVQGAFAVYEKTVRLDYGSSF